jgi:hypothetical protein
MGVVTREGWQPSEDAADLLGGRVGDPNTQVVAKMFAAAMMRGPYWWLRGPLWWRRLVIWKRRRHGEPLL